MHVLVFVWENKLIKYVHKIIVLVNFGKPKKLILVANKGFGYLNV